MRAVSALIFSNFFVAIVLSVLTIGTYLKVPEVPIDWLVVFTIFLGSLFLYSFHRLYRIDSIPSSQLGARHSWVQGNLKLVKFNMAVAAAFGAFLAFSFSSKEIVWLLPAGLISLGYTIPILPIGSRWFRLRDIPWTKPLIISGVVTYLTLSYPMIREHGIDVTELSSHGFVFLERFLFILAVTIPFEIRDVNADNNHGLRTIATTLGISRARTLSILLVAIWLGVFLWTRMGDWLWSLPVGLTLSILSGTLIYFSTKMKREEWFVLAFEGSLIVYAFI